MLQSLSEWICRSVSSISSFIRRPTPLFCTRCCLRPTSVNLSSSKHVPNLISTKEIGCLQPKEKHCFFPPDGGQREEPQVLTVCWSHLQLTKAKKGRHGWQDRHKHQLFRCPLCFGEFLKPLAKVQGGYFIPRKNHSCCLDSHIINSAVNHFGLCETHSFVRRRFPRSHFGNSEGEFPPCAKELPEDHTRTFVLRANLFFLSRTAPGKR